MPTTDPTTAPDGTPVTFAGTLTGIKAHVSRQDNPWAEITVTHDGNLLTCRIWPALYRDLVDPLVLGSVVTATGTVGDYRGARVIHLHAIHTDALPAISESAEAFLARNGLTETWTRPAPTVQQFVADHDPNTPWTPADYDTQLNLALNTL